MYLQMHAERLVGTWKLVSARSTSSTGEADAAPYGLNPSGFLTYNPDGRISALISYGGRKPLAPAASAQEKAEAFATFIAYAGRYTFEGSQVVHHVEVASIQNYVNRDLVRSVRFEGDRLVLVTPPTPVNGKVQTIELTWQRLPGSAQ
jgi:Lipocalin-like domain